MVEFRKLKRSRGHINSVITRALNKLKDLSVTDPDTYDLEALEKVQASTDKAEASYEETRQEAEALLVDDDSALEGYERAEDEAYGTFVERLEETRALVSRLTHLRTITQASTNVRNDIDDMARARSDQPGKDHSKSLKMLQMRSTT